MNHPFGLSASSTTTTGSNSSNRRKLYFVIICVVSFLMNYYNLNLFYLNHDTVDETYNTVESTATKTHIAPPLKQRIIAHRNASSKRLVSSSFNHTKTLSEFEGRISRQEYHDSVDDVSTPFTEFPPPPSEWLNDIDTSLPAPCGSQKCVFHSIRNNYYYRKNRYSILNNHSNNGDGTTNSKGQEDELQLRPGYLVSQFVGTKKFKSLVQGYKKSKELSHKFHIQNLLLGLPHKFNISKKFAHELNNSTYASVKDNKIYKATITDTWASKKVIARSQIFVQPILLVPIDHSLLFGCEPDRIQKAQLQLNTWILNYNNNANGITTTTNLSSAFYNNNNIIIENQLQSDFNTTKLMLSSSNGRCMLRDFQIFITPQTGRMYHIDIDRCFEPTVVIPFTLNECMSILQNFTNSIIKIIGKNNTNY